MQRIISFLGKNLLVLGLVSLLSLSGAFFFAVQPSYAAAATSQERMSDSSKTEQTPEQTYEQVVKEAKDAVNNPQALDEAYDRDQKAHKQEQGGLLEGAKKALEKVTNAD
jgi:capsular polysaccharide biosynthesis protein